MANTNAQGKVPNVAQHGYASFRTDVFGRIKVSEGFTLFDASHRYNQNGDFSDITAESATVTYDEYQSTALLNVTTTSGSKVSGSQTGGPAARFQRKSGPSGSAG
jgi:hypothetical protein